jgi:hypothetical protein
VVNQLTLDDFYRAAASIVPQHKALGVEGAASGGGLDTSLDSPIANRYTTYR